MLQVVLTAGAAAAGGGATGGAIAVCLTVVVVVEVLFVVWRARGAVPVCACSLCSCPHNLWCVCGLPSHR